jgi:hypothetical protein
MKMPWRQYYSFKSGPVVITFALFLQSVFIEPISKIGFWFKIPSSPKGLAGTRAAGPSLKPEAYCCMSRILNSGPIKRFIRLWRVGPKDIFEMGSNKKQSGYYRFAFLLIF